MVVRRIVISGITVLLLVLPASASAAINEGFEGWVAAAPPAGWTISNQSSPVGTFPECWGGPFASPFLGPHGGAKWAGANVSCAATGGTISGWLKTPVVPLANGQTWSFFARSRDTTHPDRLELRVSTNGASCSSGTTATDVGDFSTLLVSINPTLAQNVFLNTYTQYSGTLSGIPVGSSGCFAFRYFVTNAGGIGNADQIAVDDVAIGDPPPDTDADGVPDASDGCPSSAGAGGAPCPDVARTLTLKYKKLKKRFSGLLGPAGGCSSGIAVTILRRKKGDDPVLATATTGENGAFTLRKKGKAGSRYYATVDSANVPSAGNCQAGSSESLKIRRPN